jgi:hypothetical protein
MSRYLLPSFFFLFPLINSFLIALQRFLTVKTMWNVALVRKWKLVLGVHQIMYVPLFPMPFRRIVVDWCLSYLALIPM